LASIAAAARGLWTDALGAGDPRLAILDQVSILVSDLPDGMLGATTGTTIVIDGERRRVGVVRRPDAQRQQRVLNTPVERGVYGKPVEAQPTDAWTCSPTVVHEMGNAMGFRRTRARTWRA